MQSYELFSQVSDVAHGPLVMLQNDLFVLANEAEDWLQKLQTEAGKSDSLPIGM